jgi:hypothetical protein
VKFIELDGHNFAFQIGNPEKRLLCEALKLYPLIPSAHHRLSKSSDRTEMEADQKLLEEALAEQKRKNKKQLEALLNEDGRFQQNALGYRFSLTRSQMEWLLQVLNDIRVGSWLILGEPDEKKGQPVQLTAENAHHIWAMDLCAYFQSILLVALDKPEAT